MRRFLSRFIVVLVVAFAIEAPVAAWGVFIRLNTAAERLEPEAMEQAKREDEKLD